MKKEQHIYGTRAEYIRSASRVGVVLFLLGAFFLSIGCWSLTDITNYGFSALLGSLMNFAFFSLLLPFCCIFAYYLYSDIDVDDYGLHIKFFGKTLNIDWTDILEVKPVSSKLWASFVGTVIEKRYLVITNSRLTIFHRLYGIVFGRTTLPSFLVTSLISNSPELMEKFMTKSNHK